MVCFFFMELNDGDSISYARQNSCLYPVRIVIIKTHPWILGLALLVKPITFLLLPPWVMANVVSFRNASFLSPYLRQQISDILMENSTILALRTLRWQHFQNMGKEGWRNLVYDTSPAPPVSLLWVHLCRIITLYLFPSSIIAVSLVYYSRTVILKVQRTEKTFPLFPSSFKWYYRLFKN